MNRSQGFGIKVVAGLIVVGLTLFFGVRGVGNLIKTRGAMGVYARIIASANAGDLASIRSLCSRHYLATHAIEPARGGGIVGFPRQIHPNYQVWVEGDEVRLCPSNRVGLVYRFVAEAGGWKFDGPMGLLGSNGKVVGVADDAGSSQEKP